MLEWVKHVVGSDASVLSVTPLLDGISAKLYRVELAMENEQRSVVLRQFTNRDWLRMQPDLARHEANSLRWAEQANLPTPKLLAFDETGSENGGVPSVLMTHLPGTVELHPTDVNRWVHQLADTLVRIHQIEASDFPWSYSTYNDLATLVVPEWSKHGDMWREALQIANGPRPNMPECLIHRDYHPTNVLWQEDRLSGVVDWVNACRGPAGIDVGHCRLNLAQLYGVHVADNFLDAYCALVGARFTYEPYWDLVSILEVLPGPPAVYQGWVDLGITNLTAALVQERIEQLLSSVLKRM